MVAMMEAMMEMGAGFAVSRTTGTGAFRAGFFFIHQ